MEQEVSSLTKALTFSAALLILSSIFSCKEQGEQEVNSSTLPLEGKNVVMVIASHNFRDEELLEPQALLRSRGAKVVVACSKTGTITGMKGAKVNPDILLDQVNVADYDAVIFVGGSGASEYWDNPKAHSIAQETVRSGKVLGAICIAPVTLARAGILKGKKATVFSSGKAELEAGGAIYTGTDVEIDGRIITGSGPAAAEKFGEAIAQALLSQN